MALIPAALSTIVCRFVQTRNAMTRKYRFLFAVLVTVLACLGSASAQVTRTKPFRPPVLHTSLHTYRDSGQVPYADMKRLAGMPLVVTDSANKKYRITSFQVMYRRLGVTEVEKTGKIMPSYTFSSARFSGNQLSDLWQKIIREECKPTEHIRFFDVIVKDESGRIMFANDLFLKLR